MRECKKQEIDSLPAKKVNEKRALQKSGREKEQNKGAVIAAKNGTKGNDERGNERRMAMTKNEIKCELSSYHEWSTKERNKNNRGIVRNIIRHE